MRAPPLLLLLVASIFFLVVTVSANRVMPWMCLERCGGNASSIAADLASIKAHRSSLAAVSFELFNLGANGTLITNNFTSVNGAITAMGLETYAMISSYPYPPQFLSWMKQVFENPQPFITQAIEATITYNLTGLNVDWEPTTSATEGDAQAYAKFLNAFADAMHEHGKKLSVDVASWSELWNLTALGMTLVDRVITMSTYTNSSAYYYVGLGAALTSVPLNKLGVGFECDLTLSHSALKSRIDDMLVSGVQEIDVWKTSIPDNWWSELERFAAA